MIKLKDVYQEVYIVINQLKLNEYEKIPSEVIEFYNINRNKEYNVNQTVNITDISPKALKILLNIYYNYIIDEKEKRIMFDIINLRKKCNNNSKKVLINELFDDSFTKKDSLENTELISCETKNENIIKSIFNKIVLVIKRMFE